jgi:hypothetical protein
MSDDDMLGVVEVLLDLPPDEFARMKTEFVREMMARLRELLLEEVKKRPPHRPRENTGKLVARFLNHGADYNKAIAIVAQMRGKTEAAVREAHRRYKAGLQE